MDPLQNTGDPSAAALLSDFQAMLGGDAVELSDPEVVADWREKLQAAMRDGPELRPQLGAALGELMRESKRWANRTDYQWVPVGGGRLAVGHRPQRKAIEAMPVSGVTHVVTLLCETEGAPAIGADVARAGVKWIWLPLENGEPPPLEKVNDIQTGFTEIRTALEEGGSLYLHCSAGIHRTGMVSYALLRSLGRTESESLDLLGKLRTITCEGVGDHRLAWGNQFGD
ncbi:tyrosine-protein phosphatase [Opitutaceae bacterium]|nr:tyrosine-protein phosphatase [Opitutaceae bacterium]